MDDQVNHPKHYGDGNIECLEYIEDLLTEEEYIGYLRGNITKYNHRFRFKGKPVEDLRKAQFYHNRLLEVIERKENGSKQLTLHDSNDNLRVDGPEVFRSTRQPRESN